MGFSPVGVKCRKEKRSACWDIWQHESEGGGGGALCPFFSRWETLFKVKAAPISFEIRLQGEPSAKPSANSKTTCRTGRWGNCWQGGPHCQGGDYERKRRMRRRGKTTARRKKKGQGGSHRLFARHQISRPNPPERWCRSGGPTAPGGPTRAGAARRGWQPWEGGQFAAGAG